MGTRCPAKHYDASERSFPEKLQEIEYGPEDQVRKVQHGGIIYFKGKEYRVGHAFWGEHVGIRHTKDDEYLMCIFAIRKLLK